MQQNLKFKRDITFGVIVGNRSGAINALADEGRIKIQNVLKKYGYNCICLTEKDTPSGSVGTISDAHKCADLFKENAKIIDGIIVTLPNFGSERGIANAIRWSNLNVPVLIHAEPDDMNKMDIKNRRDSFCGKISVCNNLNQYRIPYTLTKNHTCAVESEEFKHEIDNFAAICRVVNCFKNVRIGAIGVRPASFNTVRYSEKVLESYGVSVEPIDLSEIIDQINSLNDESRIKSKISLITNYIPFGKSSVPNGSIEKLAKLLITLEDWIDKFEIHAIAFQCWTAIEQFVGIAPCVILSMLSNNGVPAACEVDVLGALSMLLLQQTSMRPSILLDWDNNFRDDPNKCMVFHCSNLAKDLMEDPKLENHASPNFYPDKGFGAVFGKLKSQKITFARLSTDDLEGVIQYYSGTGDITDDKLETFGGYGVVMVPELQNLLKNICKCGFEHHFAATSGDVDYIIKESLETYLNIKKSSRWV